MHITQNSKNDTLICKYSKANYYNHHVVGLLTLIPPEYNIIPNTMSNMKIQPEQI